eukprot:CAMPEP_0175078614 /NCGR_PEP_ID=MMETSP0052_2-20121109/24242_1 /TAXON_ID=51329 ORGANISM="Polytomella parva, Strain SAG 63-3" /NCGR_SAMPLE_ID=MMETSP0052_2 /ASSEMBLY_ACC=CAM_ASM_000194 /LENGTH=162 /DNA_ID=CAMNT_0016348607 /DNA_START=1552 /DNA_END=2036 /DNA_ORIENTATION=-
MDRKAEEKEEEESNGFNSFTSNPSFPPSSFPSDSVMTLPLPPPHRSTAASEETKAPLHSSFSNCSKSAFPTPAIHFLLPNLPRWRCVRLGFIFAPPPRTSKRFHKQLSPDLDSLAVVNVVPANRIVAHVVGLDPEDASQEFPDYREFRAYELIQTALIRQGG